MFDLCRFAFSTVPAGSRCDVWLQSRTSQGASSARSVRFSCCRSGCSMSAAASLEAPSSRKRAKTAPRGVGSPLALECRCGFRLRQVRAAETVLGVYDVTPPALNKKIVGTGNRLAFSQSPMWFRVQPMFLIALFYFCKSQQNIPNLDGIQRSSAYVRKCLSNMCFLIC